MKTLLAGFWAILLFSIVFALYYAAGYVLVHFITKYW